MQNTRRLINAGLLLTICATLAPLQAGLIGVTPTNVIRIDPSTGAGTLIGPSGLNTTLSLARDPSGTLFTTTTGSTANLATINPVTGVGTLGPAITGTGLAFLGASGLAFAPGSGVLFASINDPSLGTQAGLYTINTGTGAATLVGFIDGHAVSDIAFSPTGTLYGWDSAVEGLLAINTSTGVGAVVSAVGGPDLRALTFDSAGNLLGGGTSLYHINTATGSTTLIGALGLADFTRGMAFTATPEPGTSTLLGTGVVILFATRRRWRRGRA